MRRMIHKYNEEAIAGRKDEGDLDLDPTAISWSRNIRRHALRDCPINGGRQLAFTGCSLPGRGDPGR